MSKTRTEVVNESKAKAIAAGAASTAAVGMGFAVGSPLIAAIAAVPALLLTVRWWKHRAENGIKF
jgi:hypothetical protein